MNRKVKFKEMQISEARQWCESVNALSDEEFEALTMRWKALDVEAVAPEYAPLRSRIVKEFRDAGGLTLESTKMSPLDVQVGLALYEELSAMGFTPAEASNDNIWRYLSIRVFPDITRLRYPKAEKAQREKGGRINQKRFFQDTRRIWLKTLWWYVYLSWQGSYRETRRVLDGNGSNTLSHFIETPGRGYRVGCYRALMKEYASRKPRVTPGMFDAAMKLLGAECRVLEPELTPGGNAGFCSRLFDKIEKQTNGEGARA